MLGTFHYHGLLRKYIAVFGTLFNDINVKRIDTSDVIQEVINVLTNIVDGVVYGANTLVDGVGRVTENTSQMFNMYATQVFHGAGNACRYLANQLGNVIRKIPTVGNSVAYIVESAGGGVYHVIVAVGDNTCNAVKRSGQVVKQSTDLVVYTLTATDEYTNDTGSNVKDLVERFFKTSTGRSSRLQQKKYKASS